MRPTVYHHLRKIKYPNRDDSAFTPWLGKQIRRVHDNLKNDEAAHREFMRRSSRYEAPPHLDHARIGQLHQTTVKLNETAWKRLSSAKTKYRAAQKSGDVKLQDRYKKEFAGHARDIRRTHRDLLEFSRQYRLMTPNEEKLEAVRIKKAIEQRNAEFEARRTPAQKRRAKAEEAAAKSEGKRQATFDKAMQGKHVQEAPAWVRNKLHDIEDDRRFNMNPQNRTRTSPSLREINREHGSKSFKLIRNLDFRYSESRAKMHEAKLRVREARRIGDKKMEKEELDKFRFHTKEAKENYNGYYAARQVYGWKKTEKVRRAFVDGDPNKAIYERRHGKR